MRSPPQRWCSPPPRRAARDCTARRRAPRPRRPRRPIWGGTHVVSRLLRSARGGDPWLPGESRLFHWESRAFGSVFCEAEPDSAEAYIDVTSYGVKAGRDVEPVGFVPVQWREVVGMVGTSRRRSRRSTARTRQGRAARAVRRGGRRAVAGGGEEPGLHRAREEDDGREGLRRLRAQRRGPVPGRHAARPRQHADRRRRQGAEAGEGAATSRSSWRRRRGTGRRRSSSPSACSRATRRSASAKPSTPRLVFPRQRFERPTRFEVKTPDKQSFDLDVFSYAIGPERAPK